MNDQPNIRSLSFVEASASKVDMWPPFRTTGSNDGDQQVGRARADEVIQFMRDHGEAPMVLGHIVQAIVAAGTYGTMEVAFFNRIGVTLTATAAPAAAREITSTISIEAPPTNVVPFAIPASARA